jgi:hypothetical protein
VREFRTVARPRPQLATFGGLFQVEKELARWPRRRAAANCSIHKPSHRIASNHRRRVGRLLRRFSVSVYRQWHGDDFHFRVKMSIAASWHVICMDAVGPTSERQFLRNASGPAISFPCVRSQIAGPYIESNQPVPDGCGHALSWNPSQLSGLSTW